MDAMIENSGTVDLGAEEWLTVAARDNVPHDPLIPGDKADFSTVIFRVKGSDLASLPCRTADHGRRSQEGRGERY